MNLEGIIAISGKSGLFKIVNQNKSVLIVENLENNSKIPIHPKYQVSSLDEIAIYTYDDSISLKDVFKKINKKENGLISINYKSLNINLKDWFKQIVEDFDDDRVYNSDIKKIIKWYNQLYNFGFFDIKKSKEKTDEK